MATVYNPPKEVGEPPKFDDFMGQDPNRPHQFNYAAMEKAEDAWIEKIRRFILDGNPNDPFAGKEIHFGVGDGYARYLIASSKPAKIIHLPVGDKWAIPGAHARGLRTADLKKCCTAAEARARMFG